MGAMYAQEERRPHMLVQPHCGFTNSRAMPAEEEPVTGRNLDLLTMVEIASTRNILYVSPMWENATYVQIPYPLDAETVNASTSTMCTVAGPTCYGMQMPIAAMGNS